MALLKNACCFCTETVWLGARDFVLLTVSMPPRPEVQELYAHWKCLRERMHESVALLGEEDT